MSLYFILLICSVVVPLTLSFDKKLRFFTRWKQVWPVIICVSLVFIIPDIYLTELGVWGFNEAYHSKLVFLGIPIEEYLFFLLIPYASIFIHYSLFHYWPKSCVNNRATVMITLALILGLVVMALVYRSNVYTVYASIMMGAALLLGVFADISSLGKFWISFIIILVPFCLVDGILTGSFITDEVVWYNSAHIIGLRIFTIPIEDFMYGFSLIYLSVFGVELLERRVQSRLLHQKQDL